MPGLDAGALAVDLGPRVRRVENDELDIARRRDVELALAASLHALEDLLLHLHVPGKVVFAGLQHRARGGHRIAAALDLDRVEMRLVLDVIVGIALRADHVARLELDEPVRAGADRLQIARRFARLRADIVAEMMFRQDQPDRSDERIGPERRRGLEDHLDGMVVDLLDLDVLVGARGVGRGREIGGVLPGEDDVVGGEGLAVMPLDAPLELPDHAHAVRSKAAVRLGRSLGGKAGDEIAVLVPAGERLEEDARGNLVLGAEREMRVEQGRGLPEQDLERAAAAGLGRLVGKGGVRHGDVVPRQDLARDRGCDSSRGHCPHERASRQRALLHLRDQIADFVLVHRMTSTSRRNVVTGCAHSNSARRA